ncbi:hypothetical protein NDU88_001797 [Pleurodeles waltl]|uniref:Uncharacterized protein n=1 Tax=Pleurodeles waltl TaxID=8319 RepID=A0AAV7NL85_PLEWA|nr:hypothetical protein NDU88_001797 [Pleurodeles waltl]
MGDEHKIISMMIMLDPGYNVHTSDKEVMVNTENFYFMQTRCDMNDFAKKTRTSPGMLFIKFEDVSQVYEKWNTGIFMFLAVLMAINRV